MPLFRKARVSVRDEGALQGTVSIVDFVGSGVAATVSGDVATATITSGGASGALSLDQHVVSANTTITAGYSAYISRFIEISNGITLEIGADSDLEIG